MAGGMDLVVLRRLVGDVLDGLAGMWTHRELGAACERLGLPEPPPADECSKRGRISRSFAALADADLPVVAERIVMGTIRCRQVQRPAMRSRTCFGLAGPLLRYRGGAGTRSPGTSTSMS